MNASIASRLIPVLLALFAYGCAPSTTRYVTLSDVDPAFGARYGASPTINAFYDHDGRHGPEREEYRRVWIDVCAIRPCQTAAREFSVLFREIASMAATLDEVEFLGVVLEAGALPPWEAEQLEQFRKTSVARVAARLDGLGALLGQFDPKNLYAAHRGPAADGALRARQQLEDVRRRVAGFAVEAAPEPLVFTLHPELEGDVASLRDRMQDFGEYAPTRELSDDDVVAAALAKGLDALEGEVIARESGRSRAMDIVQAVGVVDAEIAWEPVAEVVPAPPLVGDLVDDLDVWKAAYQIDVWTQAPQPEQRRRSARWVHGGLFLGGGLLVASGVFAWSAADLQMATNREAEGMSADRLEARRVRTQRQQNWALAMGVLGVSATSVSATFLVRETARAQTVVSVGPSRVAVTHHF